MITNEVKCNQWLIWVRIRVRCLSCGGYFDFTALKTRYLLCQDTVVWTIGRVSGLQKAECLYVGVGWFDWSFAHAKISGCHHCYLSLLFLRQNPEWFEHGASLSRLSWKLAWPSVITLCLAAQCIAIGPVCGFVCGCVSLFFVGLLPR